MQEEKLMVVYSFTMQKDLPWIYPTGWIVNMDGQDRPAYIRAAALKDTIASHIPDYDRQTHDALLMLCEELHPSSIEAALNKNKKKRESLSSLFGDVKLSKVIQSMIDHRMSRFLGLCRQHQVPLCYQLQRKIKACDVGLYFGQDVFIPNLVFQKTHTGVQYTLTLEVAGETIYPLEHNLVLLTDSPAQVLVNNHIFTVEGLNAAKLKPFLKNKTIFIPERVVRDYFTGFIKDVVGKAKIEADGFSIVSKTNLRSVQLRFFYDFFSNRYQAELQFDYDGAFFTSTETTQRKNRIHLDDLEDICIHEYLRQPHDEEKYHAILRTLGFESDGFGLYFSGHSRWATLDQANKQLDTLRNHFELLYPEAEGRQLLPALVTVTSDIAQQGDWFDIRGVVVLGEIMLPLSRLLPFLQRKDPVFPLPDGTWVLIPEELFARYEPLLPFLQMQGERLTLSRMHFPLLHSQGFTWQNAAEVSMEMTEEDPVDLSKLQAELRPYQLEGVRWLKTHRRQSLGACLADDMGLGKTVQTIATLLDAKNEIATETNVPSSGIQLDLFGETIALGRKALAALIIVPASLVTNWYQECKKYAPSLQILVYRGSDRKAALATLTTFDIILTTYQTAVADIGALQQRTFNYLVLDESQTIRNKNSQAFKKLLQIQTRHKISLSGTPVENSLSDLWAQMEFINPSILGPYEFFRSNFQVPIEKNGDASALARLKVLINPYILRRTKEQVAKDLPPLLEEVRYVEMEEEQEKMFQREKSAARNYLLGLDRQAGQFRFHVLAALMRLRQIANHPVLCDKTYTGDSGKFDEVKSTIETIVAARHKVLVFSSFVAHLELYAAWMESKSLPFVMLTGSMTAQERDISVRRFQQEDEICVFLLSVKAGGTGLNLTAAEYVLILDPWWNPFAEKQAIARAHRIGQLNQVMVLRFISTHTIEEKILALQSRKQALSDELIEIDDLTMVTDEDLEALFD